MSAYFVVTIDIRDPEGYEEYRRRAPATIAAHGGKYLARGGETHVLEGHWAPTRLVILEFPSVERGKAWWNSPEYVEIRKIRYATADSSMVLIGGLEGPQPI
jgi:uncharacterized protein (DUF1330 family)